MFRVIFIFLFCSLGHSTIDAQLKIEHKIANIKFEGNRKSKVSYLSNFISSRVNTILSDSIIQSDIQHLKNLANISNAQYRIDTSENSLDLVFELNERRTLLPILNSGSITGNTWFQVGFADINWLGRGQSFSAAYLNSDGRHSGNIFVKVPRINQSKWGYTASLSIWNSLEPLFFKEATIQYEYSNDGLSLTAIRHFDLNRYLEFGGTYFIETYERGENQLTDFGPDRLRQPKWLSKINYKEDFLDYHYFYLKGIQWYALLQNVFNTIDNTWFHSLQLQSRSFARIGRKGNLANRLRIAVATNNESPFAPFVADSHVNIRGIGNRIDRGTAQLVLNTEYRQTIYETNKWGVQVVAFTDFGTWRNPGGKLEDLFNPDQFRVFSGGGIRIIYHKIYGAVLRIDYAVEVKNNQEQGFVIGLGQYF